MMTLHPCTCGAEAEMSEEDGYYASCTNLCCWCGPFRETETEAAEAWNSLMRGRVADEPKEGMVRVRILAEVDANGKWCASGWSDASDQDMRESVATMEVTDDLRALGAIPERKNDE